jgi:trimethylamine:corrinoid methyltransferase-like protein
MRNINPLDILTHVELKRIHEGVLHVLEKTGIQLMHHRAIDEILKEVEAHYKQKGLL